MKALTQALVVTRKEVRDAFRDRRAIMSVFIGALFGPILVGVMFNALAGRERELTEIVIPVSGGAHAPGLMQWLRQQAGVTLVDGPADAEAEVRSRAQDVVVVIPDDYGERFSAGKPVEIQVVADGSRTAARPRVQRIRTLLQRYSSEVAALRLIARGVSPAVVTPLQVRDLDIASAQQRAAVILNFLPLFIVLAAFTGGMHIATDSTAGERERGSLEPLLVSPVPRGAIAAGKWLAASWSSALSVCITTALCIAVLRMIPLQDLGLRFRLDAVHVAGLLAAVLPLCLLATAIQCALATFARSFKEAQSYMGFLIIVPMLPGALSSVYPIASQPWMYPVPIIGQHVLVTEVLGGRAPGAWAFVVAALATTVAAALLVRWFGGLLTRESIVFGR
ncbi:MAG: ABC transporter permease [Acidobacteria bacterium]|nr:ABC transporter permease [Acidobacteriota bacterium]